MWGSSTPCFIEFKRGHNNGDGREGEIRFATNSGYEESPTDRMIIRYNGTVTMTGLAGTGNRMVVADSSGNLSASESMIIGSGGTLNFSTSATTSYNAIFRNNSYFSGSVSGTSSIKLGYGDHEGVKIEAYKETVNLSGIKFYGENGYNNEKPKTLRFGPPG